MFYTKCSHTSVHTWPQCPLWHSVVRMLVCTGYFSRSTICACPHSPRSHHVTHCQRNWLQLLEGERWIPRNLCCLREQGTKKTSLLRRGRKNDAAMFLQCLLSPSARLTVEINANDEERGTWNASLTKSLSTQSRLNSTGSKVSARDHLFLKTTRIDVQVFARQNKRLRRHDQLTTVALRLSSLRYSQHSEFALLVFMADYS
jgi:hypothetical protein